MNRCEEPGWIEIGKRCSVGRRSLWVRFDWRFEAVDPPLAGATWSMWSILDAVELCAGREGDDQFVRIDRSNPQFFELADLFGVAKFAAET